jgi:predicted ATPase/class 3 adenylate cyclase
MTSLPSGMVSFLLTDIEGSSRLWEIHSEGMGRALGEHDRLLRQAIAAHDGHVFATAGDSIGAAFQNVTDAINAAIAAQLDMVGLSAGGEPVRVRMAIHLGKVEERDGDYFGQVLNRCGRLRDAAHGGQVLVSSAVEEAMRRVSPGAIALVDLGEHRLRDLEQPEWIFQVAHPDLQSSFPLLRTLTRATTNFPVQLTSFVGRDQELEEVAKLVRGSRLVTLTGVGGSGKTRLAMQAAAAMASEFTDGVWLIDLARISEPELVIQQVASVFGVSERANRSLDDRLIEYLGARHTLVVLDNCEHLLDSACRVAAALLGGTQSLRIMATSRESLHLPGEVAYLVPSLGVPSSGQTVDPQLVGRFDAVRLFTNRAESVRPGFRLKPETTKAVGEICRRLDGIPLAIELAAARLASFTPQQIAGHLDHRFRLLSGGRRGGLPRQETLQAAIDWSYALLNDLERLLFLRLSVFRSDFSLEAAQKILAGEGLDEMDSLEVLPRLIDKSLVVAEPSHGEMRYRLLETLRQYAYDRWESTGERPGVEHRHTLYFLDMAEEGAASLGKTAKHEEWMTHLNAEHDNMRQALRWAIDRSEFEIGLGLAGTLYRFWLFNDNLSEGAWWFENLLSNEMTVPDSVLAKALLGLGALSGQLLGQAHRGIAALRRAVELYRRLPQGHSVDHAAALNNLAGLLVTTGNLAEAEALFEEALEISQTLGAQWGVAIILGNLGRLAAQDGRIQQARTRFDMAVLAARELGSPRLIGDVLVNKAGFERDWGSLELAVAAYEEAIESQSAVGLVSGAPLSSVGLGIAYLRLGQLDRAIDLFLQNASVVLADQDLAGQAAVVADLALGRAEIEIAVGNSDVGANLLGFVDGLVEAGGYEDFLHRHQHLKAEAGNRLEPDRLSVALARGRAMDLENARQLIVEKREPTP